MRYKIQIQIHPGTIDWDMVVYFPPWQPCARILNRTRYLALCHPPTEALITLCETKQALRSQVFVLGRGVVGVCCSFAPGARILLVGSPGGRGVWNSCEHRLNLRQKEFMKENCLHSRITKSYAER
ncbi:hypothetical protein CDAR_436291 [Caerostris darwini]|uniref:Uncharacterized protein n=1 Tax=Caerostris darwini TaxID=1538125 RepID=A0AAV4RA41_9ARAC|nr:hypothetical protein CDAR_436291 [Caerostris darwini]